MKAKKKELLAISVEDLLKADARLKARDMYVPDKKVGGMILEGEGEELADRLITILQEKTAVLQ